MDSLLNQWKNKKQSKEKSNRLLVAPVNTPIPLSNGQEQLWFLQQLHHDNPFYNYCEAYVFKGNLNRKNFEKSLKQVFNDHDIFKSVYIIDDGEAIQKCNSSLELTMSFYDFSHFSENHLTEKLDDLALKDATTIFSLTEGPLFKFSLVKCFDSEHRFFVTLNHIITDKWSMMVFRNHLAYHYLNFSKGIETDSLRSKIQYADYAYHQQKFGIKKEELAYWKNKLSEEVAPLLLPQDYEKPLAPSFKGALHTERYSNELSQDILNLAKKMETTPYVMILSIYYILLYKLSNQQEISVGSPVANRNQSELEDIIGFFNDTIVLRTKVAPNMSFSELVSEVCKTSLEAFANKDVPFNVLVKTLKPQRKLNLNPFFQVMFIYHNVPTKPSFGNDLKIEHAPSEVGVAKFDLTLYVAEEDGIISSTMEYASDLFAKNTIVKFQKQLKSIFSSVLKDKDIKLSKIAIHDDIELSTLSIRNDFYSKGPTTSSKALLNNHNGIHSIIKTITEENPEKLAVTFKTESLTYKSLDEKAEILAKNIVVKTKGQHKIVGLCVDRSLDMIVGLLAILKAGCAYLPMDPEYPEKRLLFMLKDAEVNIVLTEDESFFKTLNCETISIKQSKVAPTDVLLPKVSNNRLAYVIYTSGSTGKPKGVPITHKNIITSTLGRFDFYEQQPSAFLLLSSIAFDSSKAGLFWTLCSGGNLVISEKRIEQDVYKIGEIIKRDKVSHTLMLPTLYNLILEHIDTDYLKTLNTVAVAGEACASSIVEKHFKELPDVSLYNEYGPTEATVWCIAHKIRKENINSIIPIGKAVAQAQIYLLNDEMKEVSSGEIGQLFIGGPGLSGTYLNRPDLTEAAYIENPFSKNTKLYKTGDLGRLNKVENIEFLGRVDQQVKIRGHRIEISEIENVLLSNKNIDNAVVLVNTDQESLIDIEENSSDNDIIELLQTHLSEDEISKLLSSI